MPFKSLYDKCSQWLAVLVQGDKIKFPNYDELKNNCDPEYIHSVEILINKFNSSYNYEINSIISHLSDLQDNPLLEIKDFLNRYLDKNVSIFIRDSMELAIKIYLTYEPVIEYLDLTPIQSDTCEVDELS